MAFDAQSALPVGWPFDAGNGTALGPVLLKGLFVAAVLIGLAFMLRRLFGPGGPWRPDGADEPPRADHKNNRNRTA